MTWHIGDMSLDNDTATQAIGAYFGSSVLTDEPTWTSVVLAEATKSFDSADELVAALDLMNLRAETGPAA